MKNLQFTKKKKTDKIAKFYSDFIKVDCSQAFIVVNFLFIFRCVKIINQAQ